MVIRDMIARTCRSSRVSPWGWGQGQGQGQGWGWGWGELTHVTFLEGQPLRHAAIGPPMRPAAEGYLQPLGLALTEHDTLWGGAIQFVKAE